MKKIALIALLSLPVVADDEEIDEAAKAVLDAVRDGFKSERAADVAKNFSDDEDDKVRLNLEGEDKSYSRDQAETVLKTYFKDVDVTSVKSGKDTYNASGPSAKFEYKYTKGAKQYSKRLYVSVRKKGDEWVVSRIEVMN